MIDPDDACTSQVSILKKVLLPAPLGPMMPRSSPSSTEKSMSELATMPPYRFDSPLATRIGSRRLPAFDAPYLRRGRLARRSDQPGRTLRSRQPRRHRWLDAWNGANRSAGPFNPPSTPRRRKHTSRTKMTPSARRQAGAHAEWTLQEIPQEQPDRSAHQRTEQSVPSPPITLWITSWPEVSKVNASGGM